MDEIGVGNSLVGGNLEEQVVDNGLKDAYPTREGIDGICQDGLQKYELAGFLETTFRRLQTLRSLLVDLGQILGKGGCRLAVHIKEIDVVPFGNSPHGS